MRAMSRVVLVSALVVAVLGAAAGVGLRGVDVDAARTAVQEIAQQAADVESSLEGAVAADHAMAKHAQEVKEGLTRDNAGAAEAAKEELDELSSMVHEARSDADDKASEVRRIEVDSAKAVASLKESKNAVRLQVDGGEKELAEAINRLAQVTQNRDRLAAAVGPLKEALSTAEGMKQCMDPSASEEAVQAELAEAGAKLAAMEAEVSSNAERKSDLEEKLTAVHSALEAKAEALKSARAASEESEKQLASLAEQQKALNDKLNAEAAALREAIAKEEERIAAEAAKVTETIIAEGKSQREEANKVRDTKDKAQEEDMFGMFMEMRARLRAAVDRARKAHVHVMSRLHRLEEDGDEEPAGGEEESGELKSAEDVAEDAKRRVMKDKGERAAVDERVRSAVNGQARLQRELAKGDEMGDDCGKKFGGAMRERTKRLKELLQEVTQTVTDLCGQSAQYREEVLAHAMKTAETIVVRQHAADMLAMELDKLTALNEELGRALHLAQAESERQIRELEAENAQLTDAYETVLADLDRIETAVRTVSEEARDLASFLERLQRCDKVASALQVVRGEAAGLAAQVKTLEEDRSALKQQYFQLKDAIASEEARADEMDALAHRQQSDLEVTRAKRTAEVHGLEQQLGVLKGMSAGRTTHSEHEEALKRQSGELGGKRRIAKEREEEETLGDGDSSGSGGSGESGDESGGSGGSGVEEEADQMDVADEEVSTRKTVSEPVAEKKVSKKKKVKSDDVPSYMRSTASSRAKQRTKYEG